WKQLAGPRPSWWLWSSVAMRKPVKLTKSRSNSFLFRSRFNRRLAPVRPRSSKHQEDPVEDLGPVANSCQNLCMDRGTIDLGFLLQGAGPSAQASERRG